MKITTCFVSFLFFLYFSFSSLAQENKKLDSLFHIYNNVQTSDSVRLKVIGQLFDSYLYNDVEKAKRYAIERLNLSTKINDKKEIANSHYKMGNLYYNQNQLDSAKQYYSKSLDLFSKLEVLSEINMVEQQLAAVEFSYGNYNLAIQLIDDNLKKDKIETTDSLHLLRSYQLRALINSQQGNYRIALIDNLKALKLLEKLDDSLRLADALNSLGGIETSLKNFEKGIEYNLRAIEIYRAHNDKSFEAAALNDVGNIYYHLKDYEKAIVYLNKSITISNEMKDLSLEATSVNNLGKSLTALKKYDKAINVLKGGLELSEKSNDNIKIAEVLNSLGIALNNYDKPQEAIQHFKNAIALSDSAGSLVSSNVAHLNRAKAFAKTGNFQKAYSDYQKYTVLKDSIFNTTKSQQIEELRTIYDMEKKEQQIALQENEITVLEQEAKISKLQKIALGGGLGLLALVFGFGFYGFRQKMHRNKLEKEKVDAELDFKKKELTTHAMHLAKKNEVLETVKQKAKALKTSENGGRGYQQLIQTINFDQKDDKNWENFTQYFEQVHKDFSKTVKTKYPDITKNELRLMALLKMNLSSKEIATILNISSDGIKKARQRLRKKMELSPDESLEATVLTI